MAVKSLIKYEVNGTTFANGSPASSAEKRIRNCIQCGLCSASCPALALHGTLLPGA